MESDYSLFYCDLYKEILTHQGIIINIDFRWLIYDVLIFLRFPFFEYISGLLSHNKEVMNATYFTLAKHVPTP